MKIRKEDITEQIAEGRLTRRQLGKMLAAAGVMSVTMPLGPRLARAAGNAIYFTWSGYDVPEMYPAYVEKHGGGPETPIFGDEEEALQKLRAGFVADVVHPCSGRINRWREAGVIQSIDTSRLSNWPDVFESLYGVNDADADGEQWFVACDWGNTSVLYRTDLVQPKEESWEILWDKSLAGKISIGNDITDTAIIVGLLTGAKDPYEMSDDEIEAYRAKLKEQKDLVRFYWTDTTELEQAMASGEVVAASAWNSSILALQREGVPVAYMKPKEGILAWCCGLVLHKDAPNPEAAHELIDALISPETGQFMITEYGYGHSNKKAFDNVADEDLAAIGLPRDPSEMFATAVFSKDNTRLDELQQIFEEVKAGL